MAQAGMEENYSKEIIAAFQFIGCAPDKNVIDKCIQFCKTYEIKPEDLVDTWAAFALSNLTNVAAAPSLDTLGLMERKELRKAKTMQSNLLTPQKPKPPPTAEKPVGLLEILPDDFELSAKTPTTKPVSNRGFALNDTLISQSPKSQALPFLKREDAGAIVLTGGPHSKFLTSTTTIPVEITELLAPKCIKSGHKYMIINLFTNATNIASIAHFTGCRIMRHHEILPNYHLTERYMPDVTVYGRVCCDGDGKLNAASILLETPRRGTINGDMFTVDMSLIKQCSLFPGQVVVIKGSIINGTTLLAKEMFTNSFDKAKVDAQISGPIQIVAASGPFTIRDNLNYEPLQELLSYVLEKMPDILILMGPFLNEDHDRVKDLSMTESYDSFFFTIIETIMTPLLEKNIQVILVSSPKDVHHHVVYPTPPYKLNKEYPNLLCVPDPCLLNVNGVIIGLTTADILFHMGQQELHWPVGGDKITRLARSLLNQLTFYPLYPADPTMSVDHGMLRKYGLMNKVPNVLLLPSTLRYFVKEIKGCTVINPERLVKGYTGGTFTRFQITQKKDLEVSCEIIRV